MRKLAVIVYWACNLVLLGTPLLLIFCLFNTSVFVDIVRNSVDLNIQWRTVQDTQWILLFCSITVVLAIGYVGIYFLRKSFKCFAAGELFTLNNSLNIKMFAKLLLAQTLATPVLYTVASLILSFNHPPGQKILAVTIGANEVKGVLVSLIFLVVSHILVVGHDIDNENKHFL